MDKLAEIRNQELICRERALSDTDRRAFWLAKAEEWAQRALDEIAFHFREAGGDSFADAKSQIRPGERHHAECQSDGVAPFDDHVQ
jgi:hypothetical protein